MPSAATNTIFNPAVKQRLQKILGLMGSTNDHEALAALRRAQSILSNYNLRFEDLTVPGEEAPRAAVAPQPPRRPTLKNHRVVVNAVMASPRFQTLNVRDRRLVKAFGLVANLTPVQSDILLDLAERVGIEVSYV